MENLSTLASQAWPSLLGGALIGVAASIFLLINGRIAGISGIVGGLLEKHAQGTGWRLAFILGLIAGGWICSSVDPSIIAFPPGNRPLWLLAVSGLLLGLGTGYAQGCTSGHGICGLARLSKRSLAATITFMTMGMMTATGYQALQEILG